MTKGHRAGWLMITHFRILRLEADVQVGGRGQAVSVLFEAIAVKASSGISSRLGLDLRCLHH